MRWARMFLFTCVVPPAIVSRPAVDAVARPRAAQRVGAEHVGGELGHVLLGLAPQQLRDAAFGPHRPAVQLGGRARRSEMSLSSSPSRYVDGQLLAEHGIVGGHAAVAERSGARLVDQPGDLGAGPGVQLGDACPARRRAWSSRPANLR